MKFWIIPVVIAPFALAYVVTGTTCGFSGPSDLDCFTASDGFWELFASFLIMFAIAIWVGAGFSYLLVKHGKNRS